ncbi:3D domain-containing protein [Thalassotalea mangrovi]|uniref:3D domain-containing protein n=1 Tax=Thalassotalea mangrovi TaxID=2572245 RepID=A0A4U1B1V4_9GAMM|nr:3D domain-containing protein [Thalassotalea mangrovi]TKB43206.1 hypothetical protein E8M12_15750 [Thalassotalea mangrovi]
MELIKGRGLAGLIASLALTGCTAVPPELSSSTTNLRCEDNWRITGYYTPIETDFSVAPYKSLTLKNDETYRFKLNFVNAVRIEGWGKTRFGWYLGYFSGHWHKSQTPLNSIGKPLVIGEVAVDNRIIPKQSQVHIPNIKAHLNRSEFIASDVGSAIKQKHVDVYTGEGDQARHKTYAITGFHQVCYPTAATIS